MRVLAGDLWTAKLAEARLVTGTDRGSRNIAEGNRARLADGRTVRVVAVATHSSPRRNTAHGGWISLIDLSRLETGFE